MLLEIFNQLDFGYYGLFNPRFLNLKEVVDGRKIVRLFDRRFLNVSVSLLLILLVLECETLANSSGQTFKYSCICFKLCL